MTRSDSKTKHQANLNNVSINNPLLGTNNSQGVLNVHQISHQAANASGQTVLSGKQDKKRKKQLSQLFYVNNASGGGNPIQGPQGGNRDQPKPHNNSISYAPSQQ